MFISLVQRISALQVNRVLMFTGSQGRKAITSTYPSVVSSVAASESDDFRALPRTHTLIYQGLPRSIQSLDVATLVGVANMSGAVVEMTVAVGDTVVESMPLLDVFGAKRSIDERELSKGIEIGEQRTFEQDPKYAIRLLVDIAIRALSPAINDPTTAVQALDQIEDLLIRLSQRQLDIGAFRDHAGRLRLTVPFPTWDDLLRLAFDEICACGANSMQIMRRMNALIRDLIPAVPEARRPALAYWEGRLKATIARSFADSEERLDASMADRQGLGAPSARWRKREDS